jgi:hypothetical protein
MITKTCECGTVFEYEPNPNFPDKRKYCAKCSTEKKASYEAKMNGTPQAAPGDNFPIEKPVMTPKTPTKTTSDEIRGSVAVKAAVELCCAGKIEIASLGIHANALNKMLKELN